MRFQLCSRLCSDLLQLLCWQACDEGFAREWLRQHVMRDISSSSSSHWLDAGACALLAQESVLLQCLAGTPQLMPVGLPQLQEAWTQLWSTAQQVSTDAAFIVVSCLHMCQMVHPAVTALALAAAAQQQQCVNHCW